MAAERSGWDTRDQQRTWLLALDGKVCTGASRLGEEVKLFSAFVHGQATVIGQVRVPAGTNEITQVRPLPAGLDVTGALVTADALCRGLCYAGVVGGHRC